MSGNATLARRSRPQNYPKCSIIEVFSRSAHKRETFLPSPVPSIRCRRSPRVDTRIWKKTTRFLSTSRDFSLLRAREVARTVSRVCGRSTDLGPKDVWKESVVLRDICGRMMKWHFSFAGRVTGSRKKGIGPASLYVGNWNRRRFQRLSICHQDQWYASREVYRFGRYSVTAFSNRRRPRLTILNFPPLLFYRWNCNLEETQQVAEPEFGVELGFTSPS